MQVDEESTAQAKGAASGLSISLHPLVVINISDHSTRFRCLNAGKAKRVLGVLLGKLVLTVPFCFCGRVLWSCTVRAQRHIAASAVQ